ncbi:hypothetical protein NHX12_018819 [Muraenolepis orangiensis]|uniref:U3 small nucleolar RNA-associated protein 6 homolog n=1 Tax=Muraenolepis orangiensis TaxID=630683 RepID=A0A9Q0IZ12_9TELE|nr:hypothetical protein NHX12_018819 [Muraenolepis orangiensis]
MAEVIQLRVEERIPEYEQLERVGLLTNHEIKLMIKRVTSLEYTLQRIVLCKEDFIAYVQYEINVLELIKKRREHIKYYLKREEIEFPIIQRINFVFKRATNKWKGDVQLWLSHIAFCKKWGTMSQLSKVFSAVIAIHPDKTGIWIMAAKSELEDMDSSESARQLFLRALRFHPEDKKLFQEYFRMELLHAENLRKQKSLLEEAKIVPGQYEFSPEIMSGKLAEIVYKEATEKIQGAEFTISLLTIAAIFDFTKDLQDVILHDIHSKYTEDWVTWDFMARRELKAPSVGAELTTAKGRASDIARREDRCCLVYEEGLKILNTEPMFTCYASFCSERQKRTTNVQELKNKRKDRLLEVFQRAHDSSLLKETFYKDWLQILLTLGDAERVAGVAMAATQRFSQSVATWILRLQILMQLESGDMDKLFKEALECISPKESLPLWQLQMQWSQSSQSSEETEALFKRGILSDAAAVAMEMKVRYVDWAYSTWGFKRARRAFVSLHESRPFSKTFFTRMIEIELEQTLPKMTHLRDYYERALREFGSHDNDLWLGYIMEELGPHGQVENVGKLYWRAMNMLQADSQEDFVSKYTLLHNLRP